MKKLLIGLMLTTSFLFGQIEEVFSNFFKHSTVYAGFNLTSPKWEDDRYKLSMIDPETGIENWLSGELSVHKEERDLEPDFDISATVGRVKGFEYLVKYSENRRWDEKFRSQEYFLRYLGEWFIFKVKYQDMELEDLRYGQGDLRLRKEFETDFGSLNISFGVGARTHPAYGFAPTVLDSSWYSSAWWDFAEDEFGVDDKRYSGDTDGDEVGDGGISIYDNGTGEYVGYVGHDWRWFDANGNLMAMTDREFYQYHFPRLLEQWFDDQLKGLGSQREISVSLGLDWYQYTENFWIHAWGSLYPYHYGIDKYSFHNAVMWKEHEEDGKEPETFKFLDKGTEIWMDYDAYDLKVGLNYQFVGFGL